MDNEQSSQDKQSSGHPLSASMIIWVWNKGGLVPDRDPNLWRTDNRGRLIRFDQYEKHGLKYAWVIGQILPPSQGGNDDLSNLQPLHWSDPAAGDGAAAES